MGAGDRIRNPGPDGNHSRTGLTLKSCAKVNIGLQVLGQRPDGYHTLQTLFQELEFHDLITLTPRTQGVTLSTDVTWIPGDHSNLCRRAYRLLAEQVPALGGVAIHLQKRIPAGAGLGGGSSNAATVLKGLTRLYDLDLDDRGLGELARRLGADVPFFLQGGTQLGEGIGDRLKPLPGGIGGLYLLVIPDIHISTAWAYQELKKVLKYPREKANFARFIRRKNPPWTFFENDFERIVIPAYPEIGRIKAGLLKMGARFASLSGSGSTVFGIFDDEARARGAESEFSTRYQTILTFPANR